MKQTNIGAPTMGAWDVKRRFTVPAMAHHEEARRIVDCLGTLPGVCRVNPDLRRRRLAVVYDIRLVDYRSLLDALADAGFPTPDTWWSGLKTKWLQNMDETGRENAKAPEAPCCNSVPGVPRERRR